MKENAQIMDMSFLFLSFRFQDSFFYRRISPLSEDNHAKSLVQTNFSLGSKKGGQNQMNGF